MRDFFSMVYGDAEGMACITRCDVRGQPTLDRWFHWPEDADKLVEFCEKHSEENVYFAPMLSNATNRRRDSMVHGNAVYADADLFEVDSFKLEPTLLVRTSDKKTHAYWVLDRTHTATEIEALNRGISVAHPKDETGLDTGWARNKLLRVPGTTNLKYDEPWAITYKNNGVIYSLDEMADKYEPVRVGDVLDKVREGIPTRAEALNAIELTPAISDIMSDEFNKGNRSEALYFAENELFRAGATDEQAFAILVDSNLNKWARDGLRDSDDLLWKDILRARSRFDMPDEEEVAPKATIQAIEPVYKFNFLSEAEQDRLTPTWVDDFVAWSASKTNASRDFQVASAFTALSTVFSDFGCVPTRWGDTYLNLWFMVLGRTTLDRKSTVKSHMLRVLNRLSDEETYNYDLGSDFTVEGLTEVARQNPNRSGVVVRDEVQGFLRELSTKTYMSGTKEALTDLYGGKVNGKLRATGEKKRARSTNFYLSFYGMGIQSQVGDELTTEDFGSGFLTRFIWVEPTDTEERSEDINDGFDLAQTQDDTAFYALVDRLRSARDTYELFTESVSEEPQPLDFKQEAFDRLKKFREDMMREAQALGRNDVIAPSDRLSHSVMKCAALLCMSESAPAVEEKHVLSAINYANIWFANMLKMASMVSESAWKRRQDEVLAVIMEEGNEMEAKKLYAKFRAEMKPREFAEVVQSLVDAGYLVMYQDKEARKNYYRLVAIGE